MVGWMGACTNLLAKGEECNLVASRPIVRSYGVRHMHRAARFGGRTGTSREFRGSAVDVLSDWGFTSLPLCSSMIIVAVCIG